MVRSKLNKMISIPDYWKDYVSSKVDLKTDPKQQCPFHNEQHGKSLSYDAIRGYWSCFGACHKIAADVVQMHQLNYKLRSYEDAEKSLARLYKISLDDKKLSFKKPEVNINEHDVKFRVAYAQACRLAKTPDEWIELDFIMSQYPPSTDKLELFIANEKEGKQ